MDDFDRTLRKMIGPGGVKCPCCNDWSTSKDSGTHRRHRWQRRVFRHELRTAKEKGKRDIPEPFWLEGEGPEVYEAVESFVEDLEHRLFDHKY